MAEKCSNSIQKAIRNEINFKDEWPVYGSGPLQTCIGNIEFDKICLLSNYPNTINRACLKLLGNNVEIQSVNLEKDKLVDYPAIYDVATKLLEEINCKYKFCDLSILLSPGTPTMTATWVLLGKTKFPARFYQTYNGEVWESNIPFDLTLDVLPELMQGSDALFHHLALQSPQEVPGFEGIIGDSKAIRLAVGRAIKAAIRDVSVLITGESGTGKEMFAKAIHEASSRR